VPKRPETESEIAFAEFLNERGYESEYEPAVDGKTKSIDFRVHLNGAPLFFEVKEFAAKEIKAGEGGAFSPYMPIYAKIEGSLEQLAEYSEFSSSLVLYAPDASFVSLDHGSILGGLLGPLAFKIFADQVSGETQEVWFWDAEQGGYVLDNETLKPRNTYMSAIVVLEEFPLGTFLTYGILEKMRDQEQVRLGQDHLELTESYTLIQKFMTEHPEHAKTIMRAVVFANTRTPIILCPTRCSTALTMKDMAATVITSCQCLSVMKFRS